MGTVVPIDPRADIVIVAAADGLRFTNVEAQVEVTWKQQKLNMPA